ncbi:MAG: hypothetical protein OXG78_11845 [Chloroflexi bacterium]|nr:hypothetical protein [Chloroflexota bacterium]
MSRKPDNQLVASAKIRQILGESTAILIDTIVQQAERRGLSLFLVGGVVRDIFLEVPNHDLDFVLEADAIRFAEELAERFGGRVLAHEAFGTAIWSLDSSAAENLQIPEHDAPQHIDFARARLETYPQPAALPIVSPSDIRSDLRRRDFTLNSLAIQLSPALESGRLLDGCGGVADLQDRLIRVLHEDSFVDDPTRILRALRLRARMGFAIEAGTERFLGAALPLLGRVTGKRLVNELDLVLSEPKADEILLQLQDLGALLHIHPALRLSPDLPDQLTRFRQTQSPWAAAADHGAVLWTLLLASVCDDDALAICQRLDLPRNLTQSIMACSRLMRKSDVLRDPQSPPSEAVRILDGLPEPALIAAWLILADCPAAQNKLEDFAEKWRHQRAMISGVDLTQMGIPPGPRYKRILDALRFARIDGVVDSLEEEQMYLCELLLDES